MIEIDPRPLTNREASVLRVILARLPEEQHEVLDQQVPMLEVTAVWSAGSASIETRLPSRNDAARSDIASGVLPVRAVVHEGDEGDVVGEILVWTEDGAVSGIEYAYYLGDVPSELPEPTRLEFLT